MKLFYNFNYCDLILVYIGVSRWEGSADVFFVLVVVQWGRWTKRCTTRWWHCGRNPGAKSWRIIRRNRIQRTGRSRSARLTASNRWRTIRSASIGASKRANLYRGTHFPTFFFFNIWRTSFDLAKLRTIYSSFELWMALTREHLSFCSHICCSSNLICTKIH